MKVASALKGLNPVLQGANIGCKTLFSERGKLPLKLTCPAGTSTFPATVLNKGVVRLCPKHYLLSGASQGLVQLAPLPFFAEFTCNGASGYVARCTDQMFILVSRMQAIQNLGLAVISMVAGMIVDSKGYLILSVFFLIWLCGK